MLAIFGNLPIMYINAWDENTKYVPKTNAIISTSQAEK